MATALLRLPQVEQRTGYQRSTIYRLMAEGKFPKQVSLGTRAVGWPDDEISQWIAERIRQSRKAAA